jgi:hypothetical protein
MWEGGIMKRLISWSLITASLLVVLLCVPSIASADGSDPVAIWTFTGVTFAGIDQTTGLPAVPPVTGGTISGSFGWNGTAFSNINITSTAGSGFAGAVYTAIMAGSGSTTGFIAEAPFTSGTGFNTLFLLFQNPLVNTGSPATDPLVTGFLDGGGEGTCTDAGCSDGGTEIRFITGGAATTTGSVVTPEPSSLTLLGVGLSLLAFAAIRKAL